MKRFTPSMGSIPMVESSRPSAPEIRPFTMDLELTPAMMVRPKMDSQKYSGEGAWCRRHRRSRLRRRTGSAA